METNYDHKFKPTSPKKHRGIQEKDYSKFYDQLFDTVHGIQEENYDDYYDQLVEPFMLNYGQMDKYVKISKEFEQKVKKFNLTGSAYHVNFRALDRIDDISNFLSIALNFVLKKVTEGSNESDLVGLEVTHHSLDPSILIPFRRMSQINSETIINQIEKVNQSNAKFNLDSKLLWQVTILKAPVGGISTLFNNRLIKQGHGSILKRITNDDYICLG